MKIFICTDTTNLVAPYKTRELNYDILSVLWQDFNKQKIFSTSLVKNDKNELGFTIKKLNNGFSCVKEISCDPVKHKLSVGDIIIKINDMPTNFLSHHDIVALIKSSSNIVRLEIYRPSGSDPTAVSNDPIVPELLLNSKFDTSDECNETGGVDEDDEKTIVANTVSPVHSYFIPLQSQFHSKKNVDSVSVTVPSQKVRPD